MSFCPLLKTATLIHWYKYIRETPKTETQERYMAVWSYPPTPKQLVVTACCFVTGVALFAVGAHLSLANVGPQQDRVKARRNFVKDRLRKLLDD
ncbi:uncharacterized protein LOC117633650 [Prunus dulcis]|uniref:uncharacterized protein LOC117633650 n=1 Tax=Prunus dulcis TaxID=3755 RepID=UPI001481FB9F|nr:uncharacterized protein LOC117633650 [Prunus dulcis]